MFCKNCGQPYDEGQMFCTGCGTSLTAEEPVAAQASPVEAVQEAAFVETPVAETVAVETPVAEAVAPEAPVNPVAAKFVSAFADNFFMVACILITSSAFLGLLGGSVNVIGILFAIFMWLTYVEAKKGIANSKYMRFTSGTAFANTIVGWVASGLMVLFGIILAASSSLLSALPSSALGDASMLFGAFGAGLGILAFVICIIFAGVIAVMNYFFYIPLHKLAKSMYTSVDTGVLNLEMPKNLKVWLIVIAAIEGVAALGSIGNFISFLATGCSCATYIMILLWLKKYFDIESVNYNAN